MAGQMFALVTSRGMGVSRRVGCASLEGNSGAQNGADCGASAMLAYGGGMVGPPSTSLRWASGAGRQVAERAEQRDIIYPYSFRLDGDGAAPG